MRMLHFALFGLCTLGASAVQLLPALELSIRHGRIFGLAYSETYTWSLLPARLLETVFPFFFGMFSPSNTRWGSDLVTDSVSYFLSLYLGGLTLVSLVAGWLWVRGTKKWVLSGVAFFFLLASFGDRGPVGLYEFFRSYLPAWAGFRYPERLLLWCHFALFLLAALGFVRLRKLLADPKSRAQHGLVAFGGLAAVVITMGWLNPFQLPAPAGSAMITSGCIVILICALGMLVARGILREQLFLGLCFLIALADLSRNAKPVIWRSPRQFADAETYPHVTRILNDLDARATQLREGGARRIFTLHFPIDVNEFGKRMAPHFDTGKILSMMGWENLVGMVSVYFRLEDVYGVDALPERSKVEYFGAIGKYHERALLRLMGVRYNLLRGEGGILPKVEIVESALPYLFVPEKTLAVEELKERVAVIQSLEFFERRLVTLEGKGAASTTTSERVSLELMERTSRLLRVRYHSEGPGLEQRFLVWNGSYDPHWQAFTESGQKLPIIKANGWAIAVALPAGVDGEVKFLYRNPWIFAGVLISALFYLSLALVFAFFASREWRGRESIES